MNKYKGKIYVDDVLSYGLPAGEVEMEAIGYWIGRGGRRVTSYVLVDGSFSDYQFSKDGHNTFYLEAVG